MVTAPYKKGYNPPSKGLVPYIKGLAPYWMGCMNMKGAYFSPHECFQKLLKMTLTELLDFTCAFSNLLQGSALLINRKCAWLHIIYSQKVRDRRQN